MSNDKIFDTIRSEDVLTTQKYDIILMKAMVPFGYYTIIYEGIGYGSYIRNRRGKMEALFYHKDDVYFPEKIKKIEDFIKNYKFIESKFVKSTLSNLI